MVNFGKGCSGKSEPRDEEMLGVGILKTVGRYKLSARTNDNSLDGPDVCLR